LDITIGKLLKVVINQY